MAVTYNQATLVGNCGKDPEVRQTKAGSLVVTFSVATESNSQNSETKEWSKITHWHAVTCFGRTAEAVRDFVRKGTLTFVQGEITNDQYVNREGQQVRRTYIRASKVICMARQDAQTPAEPFAY